MDKQRLRNLTTGRLHTDVGFIYEDLELITGMKGLMTHMLPNVMTATRPWLIDNVTDAEYWDGEYLPDALGSYDLPESTEEEKAEMVDRYMNLPSPFEKKQVI